MIPAEVGERTPTAAVSESALALPASGIRRIATTAWSIPEAIHLEFGEPDFDTPAHIRDAAAQAIADGATRYSPSAGIPQLREAICHKLSRDNAIAQATPSQVVVTPGGVGALTLAYRAVAEPGAEILVPDPGWPNLASIATAVGAQPVRYPSGEQPTEFDLALLADLVTDRTRAIVVNSPSNPLGVAFGTEQLAAIGAFAAERGLWVISDECYDQLWFDAPPTTFSLAAPDTRSITVFSLSKSYAMTGWRVGYAYGPRDVIAAMTRVQETWTSCVSTPTQHAAVAALAGSQDSVAAMRAEYRRRRDLAVRRATELGLRVRRPDGAFYLWLELPASAGRSAAFAERVLADHMVACAPGAAFGPRGEGHIRLSLAASERDLIVGLERISEALGEHQSKADAHVTETA